MAAHPTLANFDVPSLVIRFGISASQPFTML
jgi:hypothetical protein